ncbi:Putative conserved hypothetical protein [Candidatus Fokinia solitaria]|uniref:DUF4917 domain-containing protein n=1 Tax=Candidatus Fokinia solitaria TaxID=1802984 RepID=A0A2U8BS38_9RICK|nr:DUF4917 family protein [Candidatus Fokinia solitaria]AWD33118.1 Putative conserved hypothetical protein [Candidatus Fokinia solitaria]
MTDGEIKTFDEAITMAGDKKHLLLGNGFSIEYDAEIFSYDKICECINKNEKLLEITKKLNTTNIEEIMRILDRCIDVITIIKPQEKDKKDDPICEELKKIKDEFKSALVTAILKLHPQNYDKRSRQLKLDCERFLANFDSIYTLNFDLLSYWAMPFQKFKDGFVGKGEERLYFAYWCGCNMRFLHGALHLFHDKVGTYKIRRSNDTPDYLLMQIARQIEDGNFPICVIDGSAEGKRNAIYKNDYLRTSYENLRNLSGSLFIYGCSLSPNDDHILEAIGQSNVDKIFISLFGTATAEGYDGAIRKIKEVRKAKQEQMKEENNQQKEPEFYFFSAKSANVWGKK